MGRYDFIANAGAQISQMVAQLPEVIELDKAVKDNQVSKNDIFEATQAQVAGTPEDLFNQAGTSKVELTKLLPKPRGNSETTEQYLKRTTAFLTPILSKMAESGVSPDELKSFINNAPGQSNLSQNPQAINAVDTSRATQFRENIVGENAPKTPYEGVEGGIVDPIANLVSKGVSQKKAEALFDMASSNLINAKEFKKEVFKAIDQKTAEDEALAKITEVYKNKINLETTTNQGDIDLATINNTSRENIAEINANARENVATTKKTTQSKDTSFSKIQNAYNRAYKAYTEYPDKANSLNYVEQRGALIAAQNDNSLNDRGASRLGSKVKNVLAPFVGENAENTSIDLNDDKIINTILGLISKGYETEEIQKLMAEALSAK